MDVFKQVFVLVRRDNKAPVLMNNSNRIFVSTSCKGITNLLIAIFVVVFIVISKYNKIGEQQVLSTTNLDTSIRLLNITESTKFDIGISATMTRQVEESDPRDYDCNSIYIGVKLNH